MDILVQPHSATAELSEAMSLDDIVFLHRHRDYGAYDLRKTYPNALRKAVLLGIGFFLLIFIIPTIYGKLYSEKVEYLTTPIELTDVNLAKTEEKPLPELEKPKEIPKQTTVRYRIPEVVENPEKEELPPQVDEMEKADPGQETVVGTEDEVAIVAPPEDLPAPEATKPAEVEAKEPEVFERVEIQPEFAGGMEAFRNFLIKNLKYPNAAQKSNIQGKVYLNFTTARFPTLLFCAVLASVVMKRRCA
jgi:protein TonB